MGQSGEIGRGSLFGSSVMRPAVAASMLFLWGPSAIGKDFVQWMKKKKLTLSHEECACHPHHSNRCKQMK